MKKPYAYHQAPIYYDAYGIKVCDCPKCKAFTPNVKPGPVKCKICNFEFVATES